MTEKKPLNIGIGRRIRAAREQAGMSREKLAKYAEITPRFVADIERKLVDVDRDCLEVIDRMVQNQIELIELIKNKNT